MKWKIFTTRPPRVEVSRPKRIVNPVAAKGIRVMSEAEVHYEVKLRLIARRFVLTLNAHPPLFKRYKFC